MLCTSDEAVSLLISLEICLAITLHFWAPLKQFLFSAISGIRTITFGYVNHQNCQERSWATDAEPIKCTTYLSLSTRLLQASSKCNLCMRSLTYLWDLG